METLYDKASLILNPGVYDTGKVYATKPFDGSGDLTFTRNSNATRVNADGLVEKVRTNLLTYSNDFSNAAWTKTTASVTSGQSGYDGSNNAWKLESTGAGNPQILQTTSDTLIKTHSIYAKAGNVSILRIYVGSTKEFNLSAGTTSSTNCKITDVGGGWYRCEVVDVFLNFNPFFPATAVGQYIYLQDAQLETGDIATDYIPTTSAAVSVGPTANVPRLDYSGGATCPSLLLEPQRTNSVIWSEQIDNSGWTKINGPTITTNIATAPDGYGGADGIQDTTGGTFKRVRQLFTVAPNGTHTASVFVKKETSETNYGGLALVFTNRWVYGIIDAVNGTITVSSDSIIASSSTKVEDYGTYWRFSLTVTDNQSNTSLEIAYYATLSTNGTSTGVGAGSVRTIWGLQLELGASYATSYIPTYGSSATRTADACSKTGIASLIGQSEGTVFIEYDQSLIGQSATRRIFALNDGTSTNRITAYISSTNKIDFYVRNSSGDLFYETAASYGNTKGVHKIAAAYKDGDYAVYFDGVQILSGAGTAGTIPACSRFDLGNQIGANSLYEPMMQALLFKTRLPNSELATLTA